MPGFIVILLCACKLAFLASSTCVKTIEFSLKNDARKAYLHVHKRIIIVRAIMKEVYTAIFSSSFPGSLFFPHPEARERGREEERPCEQGCYLLLFRYLLLTGFQEALAWFSYAGDLPAITCVIVAG